MLEWMRQACKDKIAALQGKHLFVTNLEASLLRDKSGKALTLTEVIERKK